MQKRQARGAAFTHYDTSREFPIRFYLDSAETARQKRFFPIHYHDQIEIGHCQQGEGVFAAGRRIFRFRPGDTVVIPPGVPHHMTTSISGRGVWSWCFFDPLRLLADGGDPVALLDIRACRGLRTARLLSAAEHPETAATVVRLFEEARAGRPFHREAVKACVRLLLADLHRLPADSARAEDTRDPSAMIRIRPALEYIRDHFRETVRNSQLARACAMAGTTFRQHFRACMGVTPYQYLLAYRVSAAAIALRRGEHSMRAIAADHGFSTLSAFQRAFRRQMGESPGRWARRAMKEGA